jgi:hypothetical protein
MSELGTKTYKVIYRINGESASSVTRVEADSLEDAIAELRQLFHGASDVEVLGVTLVEP